ncbi:MAG: SOS response-associated peptidase [Acidobacteriota bacterium]
MCGRYRLTRQRIAEIESYYGVDDVAELEIWQRQFNIPPREMAPIVLRQRGHRRLTAGFWSLLGPWAETLEKANKVSTFNAKAETLTERPAFKNAFLTRRCVVPGEAFYEWVGPKGRKQPLHIFRRDGQFLSLAGLYNFWKPQGSGGRPIPTFTIVTTEPSQWMARIHNRMPVILPDDQIETWLDPGTPPEPLTALLKAPPEDFLECYPVEKSLLNSGLVDAPECARRIEVDYAPLLRGGTESAPPQID